MVLKLQSELNWFRKQVFGQKSDKIPVPIETLDLFAKDPSLLKQKDKPVDKETITYERKKKGHGKNPLPAHLPRVDEVVDVSETEKTCSSCLKEKQAIGEDVTEILEHVPSQLFVRRIIRPRYACKNHPEEGVTQAKAKGRLIEKGSVGEGLLAHVLLNKYVNHMPLSRQEKDFKRQGVHLPVSTMVSWMGMACEKIAPVAKVVQKTIQNGDIAYADETPLPVMREDKPGSVHRGFMWVYSNGKDSVYFDYRPGRGREGPLQVLEGYRGYLHSDAYSVYGHLHQAGKIIPVYCWAHLRRKFILALEGGDERSRRALELMGRLFLLERYAKKKAMSEEDVKTVRLNQSRRILESLKAYVKKMEIEVLPKSALGQAIGYLNSQWEGLKTFLWDGRLEMTNNLSERQIRQVVIGRKNYLFCGSEDGARRAAILYTLVGSCKLLEIDPWKYLHWVFVHLAENPGADPQNLTPKAFKLAFP